MFALLITWVALGDMRTMSVERVPVQLCAAMRADAITNDTVMAAACVRNGLDVSEAVRVGACHPMDGGNAELQVYVCNGSLPKWQ